MMRDGCGLNKPCCHSHSDKTASNNTQEQSTETEAVCEFVKWNTNFKWMRPLNYIYDKYNQWSVTFGLISVYLHFMKLDNVMLHWWLKDERDFSFGKIVTIVPLSHR